MKGKVFMSAGVAKWDKDLMLQARALFERGKQDKKLAKYARYHLAYAGYRLGTYFMQNKNSDKAKEHLNDAIQQLEQAIRMDKKFAEAYALQSSCLGRKVRLNPMHAMSLGPKSMRMIETAMRFAPENPRVVMLYGLGKYFTPAMFGGSKEIAMQRLHEAAELFRKWQPPDELAPDWGREEVYAWIGQIYLEENKPQQAKEALEMALQINPQYGWVKYQLLPKVSAKK
ncbi:MAG: tetratricopeptide repeat protein [bacterium]